MAVAVYSYLQVHVRPILGRNNTGMRERALPLQLTSSSYVSNTQITTTLNLFRSFWLVTGSTNEYNDGRATNIPLY